MENFKAFAVSKEEDGSIKKGLNTLPKSDLPEGDVLIKVVYSSINYKDALATQAKSGVVRNYPAILGIDLSGTVVESSSESFREGDRVLVAGFELGVGHSGGFSEFARVPAEWVVPVPGDLSLKEAAAYGVAGFTAGLAVHSLRHAGVTPESGEILVTGATGGVGSISIAVLSKLGYSVIAATRQVDESKNYLTKLGAASVIHPDDIYMDKPRPLSKRRWAGVIDNIGGEYVPAMAAQTEINGALALIGNVTGHKFEGSVLPFILRGVKLLGINSVDTPADVREEIWNLLGGEWKPDQLNDVVFDEVSLDGLEDALESVLNGERKQGRNLVKVNEDS